MQAEPVKILDELRERGLANARPIHTFASREEIPWVSNVITLMGGTAAGDWVTTTFIPKQIDIIVKVQVTSAFFRAVAKIGFHYALKVFPDLKGIEPEFDAVKEFIWSGSDFERFIRQRERPVVGDFLVGWRPVGWAHILLAERRYEQITAFTQFFVGPESMPATYEIRLGPNPSRIYGPCEAKGHIFLYPGSTFPTGTPGIISDLKPSRASVARS